MDILSKEDCKGIIHEIKKGDTLYHLSRLYDVPIAQIIWKNPGIRIYQLPVGSQVCIPVQKPVDETTPATETLPFIVREPKTAEQILKMFNLTLETLLLLNPQVPLWIQKGTVLQIPADRILKE